MMKKITKQFIITSGTGLIGLCVGVLLVSGLPTSKQVAIASLLALPPTGIGLIVADSKAQSKINKAERRLSDTHSSLDTALLKLRFTEDELVTLKSELATLKNALQDAKQAIDGYIGVTDENARLQTTVTGLNRTLEEFQGNYEQRLEAEIEQNWQGCLEKIKARNSQHRERERYLLGVIENMEPQFKASLQVLVQEYSGLIASYESVIGSFHPELEAVKGEFSVRLQSVQEERDKVWAMLGQYQKPRLFEGNAYGATVGNAVLNFYLEQDLIADPVKYESRGNGFVDVWLRPRTGTIDAYEKLARELYIKQAYLAPPKYKIEDGCLRISLRCDVSEGKKRSQDIEQPDSDWFESVTTEVQHIRVTGERDSGKSTLVSNLVNLKLLQNPGCKIKLCNPLYGSLKDGWEIPASWKSFDEAIDGLAQLASLILERNRIGREAKDGGLATPQFEPILYIFDEIDMTVSTHEKAATEFLKTCLKMGTHYNVHVIYIGQSPLCSTLGLKKPDLNHSAAFHLGKNIGRAIDDLQASTSGTKEMLRNQYELMVEQGNKFIVFCEHDKTQFLALPPAPNCYQLNEPQTGDEPHQGDIRNQLERLLDKESTENTPSTTPPEAPQNTGKIDEESLEHNVPKCPVCESLSIQKRGKRGNKQRYQCKDCGKHFSR